MVLFTDYLKIKKLSKEEYFNLHKNKIDIPVELLKCTCCIRHKNKYPIRINCFLNINKIQKKYICECPCRHYSRFIYRNTNNIIKTYNYYESDSDSDSDYVPSESLGSDDSSISDESDSDSNNSFIEDDSGMSPNTRKELDKLKKLLMNGFINK